MTTVKDLLHTDLRTIGSGETLEEAAQAFAGEVLGLLVVIDHDRLAGVLSERDVVRSLGDGDDPADTHVFDVMTEDVVTIDVDATVRDAIQLMLQHEIRHLVVTRLDEPYGIISARDLLQAPVVERLTRRYSSALARRRASCTASEAAAKPNHAVAMPTPRTGAHVATPR